MLLDENRESAATNPPRQSGKNTLFVTLRSRIFFPAGVLSFANPYRYKLAPFCPQGGRKSPFFTLHSVDPLVLLGRVS